MRKDDADNTNTAKYSEDGVVTFSVIIPAYNVEPYLARCLDSVIPALGTQDEIILSLEDSTDRSNELAEQYARQYGNIKTMYHDVKGLSNARNYALRRAQGTYIVYIDGDDRVNTEIFTKVIQDIRMDNKNPATQNDLYMYDFYCDNCRTGMLEPHFQIGEGGDFKGIENICRMLKKRGPFWNVWRYIYRRGFLIENEIDFLEGRICEDIDHTTSVILAQPRTIFRHDPYYIYTQYRGESIMNSVTLKRLEDIVYILERSIYRIKNENPSCAECLITQFQYEYILNMALIYELPDDRKNEGKKLYLNARDILEGSPDRIVRIVRCMIKVIGVKSVGYILYMIKRMRYAKMSGTWV